MLELFDKVLLKQHVVEFFQSLFHQAAVMPAHLTEAPLQVSSLGREFLMVFILNLV